MSPPLTAEPGTKIPKEFFCIYKITMIGGMGEG
jgi:hypothetical protein